MTAGQSSTAVAANELTGAGDGSSSKPGAKVSATAETGASVAATAETGAKVSATAETGASAAATAETGAKVSATAETGASVAATAETGAKVSAIAETGASVAATAETGAKVSAIAETGAYVAATAETVAAVAAATENGTGVGATSEPGAGVPAFSFASKSETTAGICIGAGVLTATAISIARKFNYSSHKHEYLGILDFLLQEIGTVRNPQLVQRLASSSLYQKEKAVMSMFNECFKNRHDIFNGCSLEICSDESKDLILKRVGWINQVHKIRDALCKQCYIAVVGPQNAGKSKFLNRTWNCNLLEGDFVHTLATTAVKLSQNVFAVDYPASNSLEDYCKALSISGSMNNITVIVMEIPRGSLERDVCGTLRQIYRVVRSSARNPKTVLCFNRCADRVSSWTGQGMTLDSIKQLYVQQLNDFQNCRIGSSGHQSDHQKQTNLMGSHQFTKEDIHLTDWALTPDAEEFGIEGLEKIQSEVKRCLQELEIVDDEEIRQLFPQ